MKSFDYAMIIALKHALENSEVEAVKRIENACKINLKAKMEEAGTTFEICRDSFCEGNHITEKIREVS